MIRYLLLILFILLIILATKAMRSRARPPDGDAARPRKTAGRDQAAEDALMLTCAHCGMHMPRDEALPGKGGVYCSAAHRAIVESRDVDT